MVSSLKPLIKSVYFGQITIPNQVKVLTAYWNAIRQVIPGPFEDPGDYVLQKGLGAMVLHNFFVYVLENVNSRGNSVIEPQSYIAVLEPVLTQMQGDTVSGEPVFGEDFWLSGAEGAAGSYSSSAGRRVLMATLRTLLPPIEVE
jgi:hypothetical protein